MPIPEVGNLFDPFLRAIVDEREYRLADLEDRLAKLYRLTDEERRALLPSGKDQVFANRLGWARTYLKKAGLLEYVRWGVFRITEQGKRAVAASREGDINLPFLKQYPSFLDFYSPVVPAQARQAAPDVIATPETEKSRIDPEGNIEASIASLRGQVALDLLERVKAISPKAFEDLVVLLIVGMGYGGSQREAGEALGAAGDGGIDGIVREDRLGLDVIYLQAKRWQNVVGRPQIQGFVGALHGRHAARGIFITTSAFTKEAVDYVKSISDRVILIDGLQLVDLMFEYNIGVRVKTTYEVKGVDLTFFEDLA